MFQASEPKTLTDVRPQVTSMRPTGYFLQTDGSATKKVIEPEGDSSRKIYRVTGIPGHTHTATALLEIEVTKKTISDQPVKISNAKEFSTEELSVAGQDLDDNESRDTYAELIKRAQRAIEFGVGNVQLQPENCKSYIDEPTRAIAEIRTLVSPAFAQEASTYVNTEHLRTERDGTPLTKQMPTVYVPICPINNLHIDSQAGMHRGELEGHFEFWREDQNFNDWSTNGEQISFTKRAIGNAGAIAYPVAIGRIGTGVPIFLLDERGNEERWDGTLPFDYDMVQNNYILRKRAYKLKFTPPFDFVSNGHLTHTQLTAGTTAQRQQLNQSEEGEFVIFTLDTNQTNWVVTFKNGYYYLNYDVKYSSRIATTRVYKKPRILIKGTFSLQGGELSSLVKTDGAGGQQAEVAQNLFGQDFLFAYHAPLVRWAAGTSIAVQGPLMNDIYLPALLDQNLAVVAAAVGVEFPTDVSHTNYSSMWETMVKTNLLGGHGHQLIRTAEELEALLYMFPSHETKLKGDGTSNDALAKQVKYITYPVPFAAGVYPFREDYRFEHKAALDLAAHGGQIDVDETFSMPQPLYKPKTVATDDPGYISPVLNNIGTLDCVFTYANADKTTDQNGAKNVFDSFQNDFQLNQTRDTPFVRQTDAESQYLRDYTSGILAVDQICASVTVNAVVTPLNDLIAHVYPCQYISNSVRTFPETVNLADPADRDLRITIRIDQTPFITLLERVEFRGLATVENFVSHGELPLLTASVTNFDVGNIFFYGKSQKTAVDNVAYARHHGGNFSVEAAEVEMYVTFTRISDHTGTLRVNGLCVDPALKYNYIVFYFGGTGNLPNDPAARRTLYISAPGASRNFSGSISNNPLSAVYDKRFFTDFFVTSPEVLQNVAEFQVLADTQADNAHDTRALCVAVIGTRATGMFNKNNSSDYFHPDRENQLSLLEVASKSKGTIWNPKIRISQYLTAPLISPDKLSQCISPLDQATGFLPPEMRDFKLVLGDLNWTRLGTDYVVEIKNLTFSNFDGGNQQVAALPSLLSVPEFQVHKLMNVAGDFVLDIFTAQGPPCFWCVYARSEESPNWGQQPFIGELSLRCITTGKKSNTIWETRDSELYFYTSRNSHFQSGYTASAFNERQVILLRSEDVGTMGISPVFYQNEKRTKYQISGHVSESIHWEDNVNITVVLVYINRGLHIQGKELTLRYM